ncbi:MAG: transcription elongation factor GreA [Patescibacteria group bacterium]|nr:transcription elongation factor GreA [Patescibacteria group bacterium]
MNLFKQPVKLTQQGLDALKADFDELVNVKRPALVERLANARSQGDLSENSDYQNARDELEFLDGRISELEEVIKSAVIVSVDDTNTDGIKVGTKVTVKVKDKTHIYFIVGDWEADPIQKKISHTSPLGQALIGKKQGEKVEVDAPVGKLIYEIISVE